MKQTDEEIIREIENLSERLAEDRLYKITLHEVEQGDYDPVSRARALDDSDGDDRKVRSLYIRHRVRRLKDLLLAQQLEHRAHEKAKAEKQARDQEEEQQVQEYLRASKKKKYGWW